MANIKQLREKWAFTLADKALLSMTAEQIVAACPADYGRKVTDDHRSYMWDKLADAYLESDESELFDMYDKYIQRGEDMVVMTTSLMHEIADDITKAILESVDMDAMEAMMEQYSGDEQLEDMLDALSEDNKIDIKH